MQGSDNRHYLREYRPPAFVVDAVHLDMDLAARETRVRSKMHVRRKEPGARVLVLDAADDMEILRVRKNGIGMPIERPESGRLQVDAREDEFVLEIENVVHPNANTQLEGLYVSGTILCTQCEPEGFRRITPFVDRPDNLAQFSVRLEADAAYPQLLSNGHLLQSEALPGGRHAAYWEDPFPKPS